VLERIRDAAALGDEVGLVRDADDAVGESFTFGIERPRDADDCSHEERAEGADEEETADPDHGQRGIVAG
jgi:hypothetical protein